MRSGYTVHRLYASGYIQHVSVYVSMNELGGIIHSHSLHVPSRLAFSSRHVLLFRKEWALASVVLRPLWMVHVSSPQRKD